MQQNATEDEAVIRVGPDTLFVEEKLAMIGTDNDPFMREPGHTSLILHFTLGTNRVPFRLQEGGREQEESILAGTRLDSNMFSLDSHFLSLVSLRY